MKVDAWSWFHLWRKSDKLESAVSQGIYEYGAIAACRQRLLLRARQRPTIQRSALVAQSQMRDRVNEKAFKLHLVADATDHVNDNPNDNHEHTNCNANNNGIISRLQTLVALVAPPLLLLLLLLLSSSSSLSSLGVGDGGLGVGGSGVCGLGVGGLGVGGRPFSGQFVHDTPLTVNNCSIVAQLAQHLPPCSTPSTTTAYGMPHSVVQYPTVCQPRFLTVLRGHLVFHSPPPSQATPKSAGPWHVALVLHQLHPPTKSCFRLCKEVKYQLTRFRFFHTVATRNTFAVTVLSVRGRQIENGNQSANNCWKVHCCLEIFLRRLFLKTLTDGSFWD